ncbi:MAG: DsbA family protein [Solirubrobacteraceae bacterium]
MASRTKQKEEARARRMAEEAERAQRARTQRRLRMVGGSVLGAVVVIVVAIAISSGGGASGLTTGAKATKTSSGVGQLLSGIPQSGAHLGNPKAPVTMTYYGDLQCPACQAFTVDGGFPQLIANDVRTGKVQVVYLGFETATTDPAVFQTQQVAALAAGEQQHFWDFTELFYHEQGAEGSGYATESFFNGLAKQIPGLNYARWLSARNNSALAGQVQAEKQSGLNIGIRGTPTLIFRGPHGKSQVPSAVPTYAQLEQTIKSVA